VGEGRNGQAVIVEPKPILRYENETVGPTGANLTANTKEKQRIFDNSSDILMTKVHGPKPLPPLREKIKHWEQKQGRLDQTNF